MRPSVPALWHSLALASLLYVIKLNLRWDVARLVLKPEEYMSYGGHWKFLTFINLVLQAFFNGISLLADVFILMKKERIANFLLPFRDLLFGSLVFPGAAFVATAFWTIFSYDREMIFPKILDETVPVWMNHAMHTWIFPAVLIELCITPHHYPSKRKRLALLGIGCLSYISWLLQIYSVTGKWAYPIFNYLSPLSIAVFFLLCLGFAILYSNMGAFLCRMIWGDTVVILDSSMKKSK
ncbi:androgen-dependent TFPI-regulating protein [Eublepharis macularius]|uniref:Androgen-dependent TFPI-regulating protein n=1 Tax=Eublepharis macularius TaxID=481883 RepID=A0AA97JND0_EUBMA|nr:androgen-dependent TFPI-regulating protein [Eublepharis macularius]